MPLDYSHPTTIRFLKESYDKENEQRISWFVKNKEEIVKAVTLTEKHKGYHTEHVARALVEPLMPALSVHHEVSKVNRRTRVPLDNPTIWSHTKNEKDLMPDSIMKPVDPNVTKILYEEVPIGGRRVYLSVRDKLAPEERYYFCETSNNVCGWQLGESECGPQSSQYKRYASIKRDTISHSGPQPDPRHYNQLKEHSKCDD